jgi:HAMP domain-containing protein
LIGGAAWLAWRVARRDDPARIGRLVSTVAVAFTASQLLQAALVRLGIATAPRAPLAWAVLAGLTLVSLAQVGGLVTLAFHGAHRRRDTVVSLVFGAIAFLLVVAQAPPGVAAVFGYFALSRTHWREDIGAPTLGLVILIGIGASLWSVLTRSLPIAGMPPPVSAIMTLVEWSRWLVVLYFFAALPGALLRIGVSIRSVSRRLTLSHVLTGVVPLLLVGALWFVASYLGIGAERATTAARLINDEGDRLAAEMSRAARHPNGPAQPLGDIASAHGSRWPGLRLWVLGRTLERVSGDTIPGEERLAAWPTRWRAAACCRSATRCIWPRAAPPTRRAAARPALIGLVPIREVFADVESTVRVPLSIDPRTSITAGGGSVLVDTGQPDSVARPRRGITRRPTREIRHLADSIALAERGQPGRTHARPSRPFAGHSMLKGLQVSPDGWHRRNFLLNADVPMVETFAGLLRNARENPYNFIVLGVLALLTAVFLVVAVFNVGMVAAMSRSITRAIGALRSGADQLRAGNLTHRIPVEGRDDLWSVAEAFNQMAVGLERSRELEKERERLESELALARQIQARLLPSGPPTIAGLEIAGASESARQVGGDYYDHIPLGDGRVLLVIADVSGKGVPRPSSCRASAPR